jgi:hypothetical protein
LVVCLDHVLLSSSVTSHPILRSRGRGWGDQGQDFNICRDRATLASVGVARHGKIGNGSYPPRAAIHSPSRPSIALDPIGRSVELVLSTQPCRPKTDRAIPIPDVQRRRRPDPRPSGDSRGESRRNLGSQKNGRPPLHDNTSGSSEAEPATDRRAHDTVRHFHARDVVELLAGAMRRDHVVRIHRLQPRDGPADVVFAQRWRQMESADNGMEPGRPGNGLRHTQGPQAS